MKKCVHDNVVNPPPGKHLRICLDCCKRLIECDRCDAQIAAGEETGAEWAKSGWRYAGDRITNYYCPVCS